MNKNLLICIIGTTATGKTKLAVQIANEIDGEIISADSRQVYRGMNIGTGKDLNEYLINSKTVPYHLIDIVEPGTEYNVFRYKLDFRKAFYKIINNNKLPILTGGSGMYIESILNNYQLNTVPIDFDLRNKLEKYDNNELIKYLKSISKLHNTTDIIDNERLLRAIEIAEYFHKNKEPNISDLTIKPIIFGIKFDRDEIRKRITDRLSNRLQSGMIEEVKKLLDDGISPTILKYYGLEYKFITLYLEGDLNYDDMFKKLNIAIHQFAKRQDTWWRRMEKNGTKILWIDGKLTESEKLSFVKSYI
ncbi:MAG: tRNA (adenosine(37)-N6)-dimethylallyltransferase MiaA [Bacteroidetes bacterium CG2_30_33_31]|nr:MAG: tRNA (adenosine(37)-N6)-dimethylallyltransferase MiaA [Bacteroidetes bacterium CG2_30_33_31]